MMNDCVVTSKRDIFVVGKELVGGRGETPQVA
jgi:hypothetical protein